MLMQIQVFSRVSHRYKVQGLFHYKYCLQMQYFWCYSTFMKSFICTMTDATAYKQVSYSKTSVCRLFFIPEYFTCVCEVFRLHERLLRIKHLNVERKTGCVFPCIEQGMNNFSLLDIFPNVITQHIYFISFNLFTCVLEGQY